VRVVDVRTGKDAVRLLQGEDVVGVDYAPEVERLVLYQDRQVSLYDTGSAQEDPGIRHRGTAYSPVYSTDRKYAAIVSGQDVAVWDVTAARQIAQLSAAGKITRPVFSSDNSSLAAWCDDNAVYVWKVNDKREVWRIPDIGEFNITGLRLSQRGRFIAIDLIDCDDCGGKVLDVARRREIAVGGFASFSADEKYVAVDSSDATRVLDLETGQEVSVLPPSKKTDSYQLVIFSPDGKHMVRWHEEALRVSEILDARKGFELTIEGGIGKYAYSPDGRYIVALGDSSNESLQIWEAASGQPAATLITFEKTVNNFEFSPDGKYLVTLGQNRGGDYRDVNVWELDGGRRVACSLHQSGVGRVAFSPDGRYMVTSGHDEVARVLDLVNERVAAKLAHDGPVTDASFSSDGLFIATAGGDGTARVWRVGDWKEMSRVTQHVGFTSAIVSGGDERRLITVGDDLTARVWILSEEELIARACRALTRNLSLGEWSHNFSGEAYEATCNGLQPGSDKTEDGDGNCRVATTDARAIRAKRALSGH
jgi:WD40 repeat protein